MAGETNVGSIVGFLRLDADQFHREVTLAIAEVDRLDGRDATVNVHADTTGAAAKLALVKKQVDGIDKGNARVAQSSKGASRGMGALATAIIALGPAVVPLGAAAVGVGAALGGMGTAGVLAIVGIRNEMKAGTDVGLAYSAGLSDLKGELNSLAKVAATNTLKPFQDVVVDLQKRTPQLTGMVSDFSTIVGKAGANVASGLVAGFVTLEPLMRDASVYVLHLTDRFREMMTGPGVVSFGDYVRSVFPQVMSTVESLVGAAVRLVAALAPLGGGTVTVLKTMADLINAMPVDVLATLATTAGAVFAGFRSWQALKGLIDGVSKALEWVGVKAETSAGAIRGLQAAAGIIGVAIAGLTWLISANAEANRQNTQDVNDYADALRQSNGVIDESITKMTAKKLADEGVLDAGKKLGINLSDITDAALGVPGAMERVNAVIDAHGTALTQTANSGKYAAVVSSDLGNAANKVRDAIGQTNGQVDAATQKNKDLAAATQSAAGDTLNAEVAAKNLANTYGTSASTFATAVQHQQDIADKAKAATVEMQLENNAAGLLKQSLDALNGVSLDAAQAQNNFDSQLANMGDHVTATGKKIHFTTTSIKDMSAASVSLRGQLLGQVTSAEQTAEAYGQLKGSAEAGRQKLIELRKKIIDNAVAHGVNRDAVTKYIDQFLKIPKTVPPTKLEIDKAAADAKLRAFQKSINALHGKNVVVGIRTVMSYVTKGDSSFQAANNRAALADARSSTGGKVPGYAGGTIIGPGTGTSDSVMAMVRETGRVLRVSAGEHISTAASARQNGPELDAANRGAKLQVAGAGSREDARYLAGLIVDGISRMKPGSVRIDQLSKGLV